MIEVTEDGYRETIITLVSDGTRIWKECNVVQHPTIGRTIHSISLADYIRKHCNLDDHEMLVAERLVDDKVSKEFIYGILGSKGPSVWAARNQWMRDDMEPTKVIHIEHEDIVRYEGRCTWEDE